MNMSVKIKIRVRRKVTVINHKKMVALESNTQKIELMVSGFCYFCFHVTLFISFEYAILTRVGMTDGL